MFAPAACFLIFTASHLPSFFGFVSLGYKKGQLNSYSDADLSHFLNLGQ